MTRTATLRRSKPKVAAPAAVTSSDLVDALGDQRLVLHDVSWESYVAINDAIVERPSVRMFYCDRRRTILTESPEHRWKSRCLFLLIVALADGLSLNWEHAGAATFRREKKRVGVEGDETCYFDENAVIMKGPKEIDLDIQPPPGLAIEVECSHSAEDAVIVWGRLGVPEVWRFDPITDDFSFWLRRRNGTYAKRGRGLAFPMLSAKDIIDQMRLPGDLGTGNWNTQLRRWVRKEIVPRSKAGG